MSLSPIVKGEKIEEIVTLTPEKELQYDNEERFSSSFIEEECRKAFQQGVKEGERVGYEKALHETKMTLDLLQQITRKLLEQKMRLLDQLKPEVVAFAIAICERVIRKELSQPAAMVGLVNSLLAVTVSELQEVEHFQIVLSPDDLVMLETHLADIHYESKKMEGLSFQADALMQRGDCCIRTHVGLLNFNISRELADLQAKVLQR